jgi:glycosyltransferase involved in cell wall biosynthesis
MIIHFTTVHPRADSRIRSKELAALGKAFGNVALFVQDGLGDEAVTEFGGPIVDTGPRLRRLARMTVGGWRMIRAIAEARPAIAHFHDPELLPWALLLKLFGVKVVYDAHEDVPQQILHNTSLHPFVRRFLSPIVSFTEWFGARILDGIVVPTETLLERFPGKRTVLVRNFPVLNELLTPNARPMSERPRDVTYVGVISDNRNILGMVDAVDRLADLTASLRLAGYFSPQELEDRARASKGWARVKFDGFATREGVATILAESRAGLVLLKPIEHEMVALPIKLFEYMAAGIPVVSSDFPVWRAIVDGAQCGLLVNPLDVDEIANAMRWIIENPEDAQAMGARGRLSIEQEYNWEKESESLVKFYKFVLGHGGVAA